MHGTIIPELVSQYQAVAPDGICPQGAFRVNCDHQREQLLERITGFEFSQRDLTSTLTPTLAT